MNAASNLGSFALTAPAAVALLLKVTLVLFTAWLLAALLRRRSAAARHDVWNAALLASLALVLLAPLAPAIELPWVSPGPFTPVVATPSAERVEPGAVENGLAPPTAVSPLADHTTPSASVEARHEGPVASSFLPRMLAAARTATVGSWILLFWICGIAAVVLWCLAGHLGLRRLARAATPLLGDDWRELLADTAAGAGARRPVELRASAAVATPLTWGARHPIVLLPADATAWPLERRRAALLHELAHVARHDYLAQLLGTAACALYWFHPAAWMAARRLRLESERACDDRVLASGASPAEYAAQLLEVARGRDSLRAAGAVLAIGMARPSTLEGRLLAVLDESVPRRATSPRLRLAAGLAAALALVPFAGLTPAASGEIGAAGAAATTVTNQQPATVSVHPSGGGGAGASLRAPVVASGEGEGSDWKPEAPGADPARSIEKSVAASAGEELFLDLETGAGVTITAWDEPRVEVRGRLGGRDWRDSRFEVERSHGGVKVHSWQERRSGSQSTSHHLAIRVPRRFDVRLDSAGGDLSIDGVEGRFEGSTGGGEIALTHLRGSAHLTTGGGTVRVDNCHLAGSVSTGGGPITLSRVSGGLRGSSGSGPVVYREAAAAEGDEGDAGDAGDLEDTGDLGDLGDLGDVQVNAHGDIELSGIDHDSPRATGRLHITRAGGNVRLAGAPDGAEIVTGGGEIVVGRSAGLVDAQTGGGDITIGPVAGSVRAGTGAGRVEVTLADAGGKPQSVEITSGNGAVVITLPAGFDGTIDLETSYTERHGPTSISTPWGLRSTTSDWDSRHGTPRRFVRAKGTAGSGRGGHLTVKTVNGDVDVRER